MEGVISALYFAGLFVFGIAIGSYYHVPQYAFMIIGAGTIIYTVVVAMIIYLTPK